LDKGLHPLKIADGFEKACDIAVSKLENICEEINILKNDHAYLKKCAMTALGSKVVSQCQEHYANLAV
jgi:T-complex protein 1 subunit epsilon